MNFNYTINLEGEILVISMNGRLMDKNDTLNMIAEIEEHILDGHNHMVINLAKLEYMNSTGLNTLINLLTKARNEGGEAVVASVNKKVKALFLMTKLNTVFTVAEDKADAIEKLTQSRQVSGQQP